MGLQLSTSVFAPATAAAPAGPYDLTTLPTAHDELDIALTDTTRDARLARYITECSAEISAYCNRVFAVEGLSDAFYLDRDPYPWQVPGGVRPLQLSRWPLVGTLPAPSPLLPPPIQVLATSAAAPEGATTLSFAAAPAAPPVGSLDQVPVSGPNIAAGTIVGGVSGDTVTLSQPLTAEMIAGTAVAFGLSVWQTLAPAQNGISAALYQPLVLNQDYAVDQLRGALMRLDPFTGAPLAWEAITTTVLYYAGYASLPPDVERACLRLVTDAWYARGRDPALMEIDQPSSGHRRYWVGGPPKSGGFPEEVRLRLDKYRVPVIA